MDREVVHIQYIAWETVLPLERLSRTTRYAHALEFFVNEEIGCVW